MDQNVVVLVGGVGGAKLAYGLAQLLPPERLTVIVNVADDFWHYGLRICPDADTLMYTLSGLVDPVNGWGIGGDTTAMLDMLRRYEGETWFRLGDRDLATHLIRTQMLRAGERPTQVMQHLATKLGVACTLLPATDAEVMTLIETAEYGTLEFQDYFVRYRWQPVVKAIRYSGIDHAKLTPEVEHAIDAADVILFGPSNPWLSVQPILAIPGMRERLLARRVPRVAVTPIVGGEALKGPAAKIMRELGLAVSPVTVAAFYGDLINGFVVDQRDANLPFSDVITMLLDTIMPNNESKLNLARQVLMAVEKWGAV
ncbi:MAG: 2-phospho-L-lactate transferase [Armatimonadetes bacterium]|nr:2-phospho-L-lactate transferase [Anaerolineae bacterium]